MAESGGVVALRAAGSHSARVLAAGGGHTGSVVCGGPAVWVAGAHAILAYGVERTSCRITVGAVVQR